MSYCRLSIVDQLLNPHFKFSWLESFLTAEREVKHNGVSLQNSHKSSRQHFEPFSSECWTEVPVVWSQGFRPSDWSRSGSSLFLRFFAQALHALPKLLLLWLLLFSLDLVQILLWFLLNLLWFLVVVPVLPVPPRRPGSPAWPAAGLPPRPYSSQCFVLL